FAGSWRRSVSSSRRTRLTSDPPDVYYRLIGEHMTGRIVLVSFGIFLSQIQAQQPKGKAPDQGYVPEGWHPHEGGNLKNRVATRFGEEPATMPGGWKFGRVSAVTTDSKGDVYVFHRGAKADPIVVFDAKGNYLRAWGRGLFGN